MKLFEVAFSPETPHIHQHRFIWGEEAREVGFFMVEMCCHACGEAVSILWDFKIEIPDGETTLHPWPEVSRAQRSFVWRHCRCATQKWAQRFKACCPDARTNTATLDFRGRKAVEKEL